MNSNALKFTAAALFAAAAGAANAQVSVGASINVNVPGVYGRVDIGPTGPAYAPPAVIYDQPVVIEPSPVAIQRRPIYLYVPEAYTHDWRHHCAAYGACGQPVYFVREQWVHDRYVQHYPHDHRFDHGPGPHGDWREARREEYHEERHEERRELHDERHDDHRDDHHDHDHDRR